MFPRRYFPAGYFAPRYFPESEGEAAFELPGGRVARGRVFSPGAAEGTAFPAAAAVGITFAPEAKEGTVL